MVRPWTAGPWKANICQNDMGSEGEIFGPDGKVEIAYFEGHRDMPDYEGNYGKWAATSPSRDEGIANAELIALAPEMAEAILALDDEDADMAEVGITVDTLRELAAKLRSIQ